MIETYTEHTPKLTFAAAVDWPGWARKGRDEAAACQALLDSAPRYAQIVRAGKLDFPLPAALEDFAVAERVPGDSSTQFGVLAVPPALDARPVDDAELARLLALLDAYWKAFDAAVDRARGKELRKGPRGGGRELDKIVEHVVGAEGGYLSMLAWKWDKPQSENPYTLREPTRQAVRAGLTAAAHGESPQQRPRGGAVWSPRYFVRRLGWHVLDHLWEIEDRLLPVG